MPIAPGIKTKPISYDDFHALDYDVMGIVFSIHRDLGRFWNEKIYQNELVYRCRKAGFGNVATEVPINISYKDFTKVYKIDVLIDNVIYEIKTAQILNSEHEKQIINYLLLTGLNHGKLINIRPPSVQHRFVSTKITPQNRYKFSIDDKQWQGIDEDSIWVKDMFELLLKEWGVFLGVNLFYDAIMYFRGGEVNVLKEIEVRDGARILGKQKVHLLNPNIVFKISSLTKTIEYYEKHLRRFLHYTSLQAIHWINFNRENVEFRTLLK